jgi:hypothetical protein
MPCGLEEWSSNEIKYTDDGDNSGWSMYFQHANDIMQVKGPSSTTVWKMFHVNDFVA